METDENILCYGCLCKGRRMVCVEFRKKQCFLQIISEIPIIQTEDVPVWLCWECDAVITRFINFKKQVKHSYKMLLNYSEKNLNITQIEQPPKLRTHKTVNVCLPDIIDIEDTTVKLIKIENLWDTDPKVPEAFKIETDPSVYSDHASDDDTALIDIAVKMRRKKVNGNLKKRRKRMEVEIYKEIELSGAELEEERKLKAACEEYVNAMFKCERCIISFPNVDDLKDHVSMKHELNASHYKCDICECTFATEVSFNYHTNKHRRRYQCSICEERFSNRRGASKHYEVVHCVGVDADYEAQESKHGQTESAHCADALFQCEFCEKSFRWKTSLRKHAEKHRIEAGQKRRPYCEPCRLSFTTTSNLQKHVRTSSKHQIQLKLRKLKESLPESVCAEKREAHVQQIRCSVMSARQVHACAQCGARFQWRGNLLRHLHSHAARANGELVCKPCNRTFSSIATYKQHMRISKKHVTENDFKYMCTECGKRFASKTRLKDHVDWEHLKNYVHTCPVCQKVFKSNTSLYLHKQVVHKKDNAEHLCDHCGKAFPNHAKLRGHIKALHTTESPYKCGSCSAGFSWYSCLSRHVRRVHRAQSPKRKKGVVGDQN